jgi:hypothetical protein
MTARAIQYEEDATSILGSAYEVIGWRRGDDREKIEGGSRLGHSNFRRWHI